MELYLRLEVLLVFIADVLMAGLVYTCFDFFISENAMRNGYVPI